MPQIVFSEEEKAAIEAIVAEFDPEHHELTQGLRDLLSEEDWRFVVESFRKTLRREVEGALARPVIEDAEAYYQSHADPDGMTRLYELGCSLEERRPLQDSNFVWGRSPLWQASALLMDEAELAVQIEVAAV